MGFALLGAAVIAGLEAPLAMRVGGIIAFPAIVGIQLAVLRRGWSQCVAFRVCADGAVRVLGPDGEWSAGRLEPDGMLLRRWGWIRLRAESGRPFAEPVRGSCRESREWRRLQVIWRHVGA